jgi:hypothetical protein
LTPEAVQTGTITGTVTNASGGAAISGATVSGGGVTATTNASGVYTLANVAVGTVTVTASATGFTSSSASVTVTAGGTATQNFLLTVPSTVAVGYTPQWLLVTLACLTLAGGILLKKRMKV